MKKLKVAVLMGGNSNEHEVSVATGINIVNNLDPEKYQVRQIKITKNNDWLVEAESVSIRRALKEIDVVFNALHGEFGEDGSIQGLLEFFKVPYTGSGVLACALSMDKPRARSLFRLNGLTTPGNTVLYRDDWLPKDGIVRDIIKSHKLPAVIKPANLGSSIGVSIIRNKAEFEEAIKEIFKYSRKILLEEYIEGQEVTCGVLDQFKGQESFALPVTAIYPPPERFFDYEAKYNSKTREITPAPLDEKLTKKIQRIALTAHQVLGCRGYSRTDMIIKEDNIFVLETNALPGLSPSSLFPKAVQTVGLDFSKLLDHLINISSLDHRDAQGV